MSECVPKLSRSQRASRPTLGIDCVLATRPIPAHRSRTGRDTTKTPAAAASSNPFVIDGGLAGGDPYEAPGSPEPGDESGGAVFLAWEAFSKSASRLEGGPACHS